MNPSSAETQSLVRRTIQGDRGAIDELLALYRPQLRRMVAVRMDARLKPRVDPSDVVQQVLAEAAQKMVTLQKPPKQFYPWLRQLAWDELARLHLDHIRTKKRSVSRDQYEWQGHIADESMVQLADRLAVQQLETDHQRAIRSRLDSGGWKVGSSLVEWGGAAGESGCRSGSSGTGSDSSRFTREFGNSLSLS